VHAETFINSNAYNYKLIKLNELPTFQSKPKEINKYLPIYFNGYYNGNYINR